MRRLRYVERTPCVLIHDPVDHFVVGRVRGRTFGRIWRLVRDCINIRINRVYGFGTYARRHRSGLRS